LKELSLANPQPSAGGGGEEGRAYPPFFTMI